ncbi:MAG: hypothetical protein CIT03_08220 [Methanobacterium sp.]|nr:MAG: hypothetical protein CIT03_08220 [Methanobacterium sp.]
MYLIRVYSGGIYKFDEFVEFVEDLGGLVLKKDSFHISRGQYYLSEEIRVLTIIPPGEEKEAELMARKLKGSMEKPDMKFKEKKKILSCLAIYDCLGQFPEGMEKTEILKYLKCPCPVQICNESEKNCYLDYLDEVLDGMVEMEFLEMKNTSNTIKYILKKRSK